MKVFNSFVLSVVLFVSLFANALSVSGGQFPEGPNPVMTPGSLCSSPTERRYPEKISYCARNVSSDLKNKLIKDYDVQFGYSIEQMARAEFKIDHFIPLSIGGSNNPDNLWPQHKSVYTVTDPLEQVLSDKISQGRIKQDEAVRVIREGKLNLGRVPELIDYVNKL